MRSRSSCVEWGELTLSCKCIVKTEREHIKFSAQGLAHNQGSQNGNCYYFTHVDAQLVLIGWTDECIVEIKEKSASTDK